MDLVAFFSILGTLIAIGVITIGIAWKSHSEVKDFNHKMNILSEKMNTMFMASSAEIKDFHGRLCALEEKYIQVMQRIWEKH